MYGIKFNYSESDYKLLPKGVVKNGLREIVEDRTLTNSEKVKLSESKGFITIDFNSYIGESPTWDGLVELATEDAHKQIIDFINE